MVPSNPTFPHLPISRVAIPSTPLTNAALAYSRKLTSPSTVNHCLRSVAFALILARKLPPYASADPETLTLAVLMHDLGWAQDASKSLLSTDKRFEVDGANLARDFIGNAEIANHASGWDEHRLQLVWDAIALHTTPSIAAHKQPVVALVSLGVLADFTGPNHPTGTISVDEYKEVVATFPRLDFREELPKILCGLCVDKPQTTYDNFVGDFGLAGLQGAELETFKAGKEKNGTAALLLGGLQACEQYE
ncbi:uncharacterized protein EHS24_006955 [Apiotrichum porosum]|uniref:HD domain-containing protein n=1 Tax=Apiotrichum porosum TaxID=105984 RepID=A0A427XWR2_9TREE|nr:uncharacterized protein EHS24_006955 [Apiotrichum porosum]RSH83280.1 hypothetical protein EHS24_006955 [Apiotrichum porosum]